MVYNHPMDEFGSLLSKAGLAVMLDHIHAMAAVADADGNLLVWNRALGRYAAQFSNSKVLGDLFVDADDLKKKMGSGKLHRWVAQLRQAAGSENIHCDCLLNPLGGGRVLFVAEHIHAAPAMLDKMQRLSKQVEMFKVENEFTKKLVTRKQTELEGVMTQAREILQIDPLTFLANRRLIVRELQNEVLRANRYKIPFSISVVDIDHFKNINDSYGHLIGDEVLRSVALQLRDDIRHPDMVGRYGGEEFLILLPNSTSAAAAEQAMRLCKHVRETTTQIQKYEIKTTISMGIAELKHGADTWETLLNRADAALYEAKNAGRDRWEIGK